MIAALDVQYDNNDAVAGMVVFSTWSDRTPVERIRYEMSDCVPYEPGQFYKRELPVLLQTLKQTGSCLQTVIVDGYVDLGGGRHGLGRHLFDALNGETSVVGVAKTRFEGNECAIEVFRGASTRPLFVTAAGCTTQEAARRVKAMHGANRMPTLLKMVDSIARGHEPY